MSARWFSVSAGAPYMADPEQAFTTASQYVCVFLQNCNIKRAACEGEFCSKKKRLNSVLEQQA
jgi:hypothetical protein